MASAEGPVRVHGECCAATILVTASSGWPHVDPATDRHSRRRPFASWMKRLANLKSLHTDSSQHGVSPKRSNIPMGLRGRKPSISKNNPYPLSTRGESHNAGHLSFSTPLSSQRSRHSSLSQSKHSMSISHESHPKSRAPTLGTTAETTISEAAQSAAANTNGDRNSTFSSPAPSLRSMTTTLTTIQSTAPPNNAASQTQTQSQHSHTPSLSISTSAPYTASAVPSHLTPHAHPTTYHSATANNVLTDDASILTLASSSKRRRRNSLDTNASIRALAPASVFGGSHESLPLSVLSGTIIHADSASLREASGVGGGTGHSSRPTLGAERTSLISASGVTAPALASERNSYIGQSGRGDKYGDTASVRSGLLGSSGAPATQGPHGRNDSLSGSVGYGLTKEKERDREASSGGMKGKENAAGGTVTPAAPTSAANENPPNPSTIQHGRAKELSRQSSGWDSRASMDGGRSPSVHGSLEP